LHFRVIRVEVFFFRLKGIAAIKVKVYLPAFVNHDHLNPDGTATLEESAILLDLYRLLKLPVPLRLSVFFRINYEPAKWNTPLKDGDTVTFLFPISGG
jgi:molybdopterin converting factor small subunit